jgi:hypothetical protein
MSRYIIFVHSGFNEYLLYTISITKHYNKDNKIILLGDDHNKRIANQLGIDFFHYADYTEEFPYYHVSVNGRQYEKFCFERWFIIYNFLRKHRIEKFVHSDSDNAICYDVATVDYENACIGNPMRNQVIVPNIFFSTQITMKKIISFYRMLFSQDFPDFLNDIRRYSSMTATESPPVNIKCLHYSDMYFLLHATKVLKIEFFVLPESGTMEVIYNGNFRNHPIIFKDGFYIHESTGQRMFNIHFQGDSKSMIHPFFMALNEHQSKS